MGIVDAQSTATITWLPPALPTPAHYILYFTKTTLYTASLFRGAARKMSSTLQVQRRKLTQDIRQLVVVPDDHLCGFTGTKDDLPLELVALGHTKLLHRTDRPLF